MAAGDIKMGLTGAEVILPNYERKLAIEEIELKKTTTMASGKEKSDIIGYKKNFTISYKFLIGSDLSVVLGLYDLHQDLNIILINEDLTETTYSGMILEPIPQIREICLSTGWRWESPVIKLRMRACYA